MSLSSPGRKTYRGYALVDPVSKRAHYVGQTAAQLGLRLDDHIRKPGDTSKGDGVRHPREQGHYPEIILLEQFIGYRRQAYVRESHWINRLRAEGHSLFNNVRRRAEVDSTPSPTGVEALPEANAPGYGGPAQSERKRR